MLIDDLIKLLQEKKFEQEKIDLIKRVYYFAEKAHEGKKRLTGEDYIKHPLATAYKLAQMNFDSATIASGLLHDVPEDTETSLEAVKKEFGSEIATLVEGITKLGKIKYRGVERYINSLKKMFVATAKDIRVILIKLADRIDNLKTLHVHAPVKQQRIARETLEIYAPIAHRLGMGGLKGELEDLSFPYVYPEEYKWVKKISSERYKEKQKTIDKVKKLLKTKLDKDNIPYIHIESRSKHYYSLYKKLLRKDMALEKIYDLIALRIITKDTPACYQVLGAVHDLWPPMKGRIKDYIAQPKPNNYRSLHTTVYTDGQNIIELQIRSEEMHEEAEYGISAHWHYKKDIRSHIPFKDKQVKWVKELTKWQKEFKDTEEYIEALKLDIFQTRIFVFTPKGDVIDLPGDATPIDFAYHIHSEVGDRCTGAKVNEKIISLESQLKSGDMVEIMTDKNRKSPNEEWLNIVKTNLAKNKIKQSLKKTNSKGLFNLLNPKNWDR